MLVSPALLGQSHRRSSENRVLSRPFCECWNEKNPTPWSEMNACTCGEDSYACNEWCWESPANETDTLAVVSSDQMQVTFHPYYSSGTAAILGNMAFQHDRHYYYEIKMLTEPYGTDIMIGVCSNKMNLSEAKYKFISLLGLDEESYGLSYKGDLTHNSEVLARSPGFCKGTIVGVKVDMWLGILEFYLNRQPIGVTIERLRRHRCLFPVVCSTAAQSSVRLVHASSFRASLLVDAARTLAASVLASRRRLRVPPGLWTHIRHYFWMVLPTEGCINEDQEESMDLEQIKLSTNVSLTSVTKRPHWHMVFNRSSPDEASQSISNIEMGA